MLTDEKRDNFRSYVKFGSLDRTSNKYQKTHSIILDIRFLADELISSQCDNVILYSAFGDNRFGKLCCTNFRLHFEPLIEDDPCCSRSLYLQNEYEIPLCSIEEIYYSTSTLGPKHMDSKKFRPMTAPFSTLEIVSCLKIFVKDFRVFTFDFQKSQFAVSLANQILHFSRPARLTNMFQVGNFETNANWDEPPPLFENKRDWESELERCRVFGRFWRCSFVNSNSKDDSTLTPSYPGCVVVPAGLAEHQLPILAKNWINGRFPIWVWSSPYGCAILRSSDVAVFSVATEQMWQLIVDNIAGVHPICERPFILDATIDLSKIQSAYNSLRKLCSMDSNSQFLENDDQWFSNVGQTGWCQLVSYCLKETNKVVQAIVDRHVSVVIKESSGVDLSAVISSLSQICLDPHFRCRSGLARLVQKDWVSLGHPFGLRLFGASVGSKRHRPNERAPVLLLFLDCLSQLLHLYPGEFSFSQTLLVSVWDLAVSGLTSTFSWNFPSEFTPHCCAFPLDRFYSSEHCHLFDGQLFDTCRLLNSIQPNSQVLRLVLRPSRTIVDIRIWNECYLRWIEPTRTAGGGRIMFDISLWDLNREVARLFNERNRLLSQKDGRQRSGLIFKREKHPAKSTKEIDFVHPQSSTANKTDRETLNSTPSINSRPTAMQPTKSEEFAKEVHFYPEKSPSRTTSPDAISVDSIQSESVVGLRRLLPPVGKTRLKNRHYINSTLV